MKKNLLITLIIALFIYSCTKNNVSKVTTHSEPAPNITGTWTVTGDSLKEYDSSGLTSATDNTFNKGEIYRFNADGSGYSHIDTIPDNITFTYTVPGSYVVLNYPMQNYKGDQIDTARIGALTSTNLELIYKGYFFDVAGSTAYYETDVFLTKQTQTSE